MKESTIVDSSEKVVLNLYVLRKTHGGCLKHNVFTLKEIVQIYLCLEDMSGPLESHEFIACTIAKTFKVSIETI